MLVAAAMSGQARGAAGAEGANYYAGPDRRRTAHAEETLGRPFALAVVAIMAGIGAGTLLARLPLIAEDSDLLSTIAATAAATTSVVAGVLCLSRYSLTRERCVLDGGAILLLVGVGWVLPATVVPLLTDRFAQPLDALVLGAAIAVVVASVAIAVGPAVDRCLSLPHRLVRLLAIDVVVALAALAVVQHVDLALRLPGLLAVSGGLAAALAALVLLVTGYRRRSCLLLFVGLNLLGVQMFQTTGGAAAPDDGWRLAGSVVALVAAIVGLAGSVVDHRSAFRSQQTRLFQSWIDRQVATRRQADQRAMEEERFHDLRSGLLGVEAFLRTIDLETSSGAVLSELGRLRALASAPVHAAELFDLAAPVRAMVAARRAHPIELRAPACLPVIARRGELLEAIQNLVDNAVRHAPGSAIELEISGGDPTVEIVVTDQGPGIAADQIAHVWERGYTTHHEGSGLGLYIVANVVDTLGGTIEVRNRERGVSFVLRLDIGAKDTSCRELQDA